MKKTLFALMVILNTPLLLWIFIFNLLIFLMIKIGETGEFLDNLNFQPIFMQRFGRWIMDLKDNGDRLQKFDKRLKNAGMKKW